MGKLTISMAIFNSYVWHNQRVIPGIDDDYYVWLFIWVNYDISRTWIVGPFGDDFPQINHDSRVRENSEVVIKFTQIYGRFHPHWHLGFFRKPNIVSNHLAFLRRKLPRLIPGGRDSLQRLKPLKHRPLMVFDTIPREWRNLKNRALHPLQISPFCGKSVSDA